MKNDLQSDVEHRESEINKETNIEENNNFLESNDVKPLSAPERATQVYDLVQITYSRFLKLHKGPDDLQSWTPVSNSKSGLIVTKKIINLNSIGSPITTTNNFWQPTTNSTSAALLPLYKGTKVLCGKSVEEVFSVIRSYGCRKKWDDTFEDGRLLEYCGEGVDISSVSLKPYFPLSRRNLTVVNSITRIKNTLNSYTPPNENYKLLNNNSSVVFTSCSIPPDCLTKESWKKLKEFEKSGIRAELIFSAWVLEPLDPYDSETKYPIPSTRVTYYVQMDLGTAYSFFMGSFPSCINGLEKYCNKIPPYVEWPKTGKVEKVSVQKSSNLRVMDTLFDEETGTYTLYCDSSIYCEKAGNLQASATEELLIQFIVNLSVYPNQYEIEWTFDHIKISEKETTDFKPKLRFEIMELDPTLLEEKSENHSTRRSSFSEKALYQPRHLISVYFVNKELKLLEKPDKNVSDGPQAALELKDRFYFEEKSVELKKDGNYIKFKFVIKKSTLPLTSLIDREKFYIFVNGFKTLIKSRNNNDNSNIKVDEKIFEKPSSNLSSSIGSSSTSPINIDKKSIRK
ncbi:hypothetical protein HK099_003208 [Clydaea vesicula]|uniref:START domain-containing protein n=1 Tax=Clydaea vesicula TaxID=447962 RepID=A0AAD5XWG3_9FUNG|nr:hypothetical protein HK099_003208 [Clydaea vesicula]